MRSDLEKLEGVDDIRTDIQTTTASFRIPKDTQKGDLEKKLDEFEQTNEHMADWSFIEGA